MAINRCHFCKLSVSTPFDRKPTGYDDRALRIVFLLIASCAVSAMAADCVGWRGFDAPVRYASSAVQTLVVRDLDGDGAPDIIASGNQVDELGTFSIFANRGDGTFAAERLFVTGFGQKIEVVGDLDGDGIPDIVASDYWSSGIVVYHGKGVFDFDRGVPYTTATHGGPTFITDYDRDGKPDVISLSFGSGNPVRIHFFHGNSDGTLAAKTTFETGLANANGPSSRTINGVLEILSSERSGHLGLIRYDGGIVSVSRTDAGPGFDLAGTFADVNGDGIADIIDANDSQSDRESIFVTLANADGTFRERTQLTARRRVMFPVALRVADVDGDGHADLVVSDFRTNNLDYFRGDGAGGFAEAVAIDAGAPVNAFEIKDVNGDGFPDIVTANNDHTVSVLINRGQCRPARRRAAHH
jgi:hypothetical protein